MTRRQVMVDLAAREKVQEVFKSENGLRVIPGLIEPEPHIEHVHLVENLAQVHLEGFGPLLWAGMGAVGPDATDATGIQGADPVLKKIDGIILRDDSIGIETCHRRVDNAELIRLE